ncbi:putative Ig domain-containing protein, partial [Piscinibacter sp.]|uniref:putative Ig domain-containing protein n=1 Tax=Piscinibacter sp. TaxID=1903157 RepID=UPI002CF130ED
MTTPRPSSCTRCRWLRWGLSTLAAAAGVAVLHAATMPAVPASAPGGAASAPASAPALAPAPVPLPRTASAPAVAPPDLRLVYKTVVLPSGRLGSDYRARVLVRGGTPPYAFTVEGKFPPGLDLADDGTLAGRPTAAGNHRFTLMVSDASNAPLLTQQAYVLYVAPARTPAASAPPPPLAAIPRDEAAAVVDRFPGVPRSYKLTHASLAQLVPAPPVEEVASDDATTTEFADEQPVAAAPAAEPLPTAEQLGAMLAPLLDVEYPTRALFLKAVQAARCAYYQAHVADAALKKGVAVDAKCPPDTPPTPPASAAKARRTVFPAPAAAVSLVPGTDALPLHQFYAELMPPDLLEAVVAQATQHHPLGNATEIAWTGDGCGCVTPMPGDQVYGFFPFWHASEEAQALDFSLFARISAMGAVLNDDGVYSLPAKWLEAAPRFVREARRHGTGVDLVIYRRDWRQLLALPEARLNAFSRLAAANAVAIADARVDESFLGIEPLLARFWDTPAHAYDGITVFFEDSPVDPEGSRRFASFLRGFMLNLIAEMQRSGRAYRLNVAVPDQLLGDEGPYGFAQLLDYIELAELPQTSKGVEHEHKLRYKGTTDIVVEYL